MNDDGILLKLDGGTTSRVIASSISLNRAYNQVPNVGVENPIPMNELAQEVSKAMGVRPRVEYLGEREEVKHAYCSHRKIKEILNFRAKYTLLEGLKIIAEWAKTHGSRKSRKSQQSLSPDTQTHEGVKGHTD